MRAAIYARVSTEDQAKEGYSIPAQLKRLHSYCKARGWQVGGEYVDEGFSGRTIARPAYHRMMEEKDGWDVLVVLKMDRIHRNSKNFTAMMDLLRDHGKEFNSMQESFDSTTAIGRFVMDTIQRIAQLESEQIGERVKVGMSQKAKKGKGYLGFPEPYGYRYESKSYIVVPEQAEVISHIYHSYLAGLSLREISSNLNQNHIIPKKGGSWQRGTVYAILTNPFYSGDVIWDGIRQNGHHHPIISSEMFHDVQTSLAFRKRGERKKKPAKLNLNDGGLAHA